ncbi:MAG: hypothetical protein ACIAXF_02090 [Phycisphaerales bacterium JB063]
MSPTPPDDPPTPTDADSAAASPPPGRGLLAARFAVVALLSVGLLVFGLYAFNDLANGIPQPPTASATDTLALDPDSPPMTGGDMLQPESADEVLSDNYIPIDHDPARLPAYPGAERDVCHRLKPDGRFSDERAVYTVPGSDATPQDVIAHYRAAAEGAGFTVRSSRPVQGRPDSLSTLFTRGEATLTVMVNPYRPAPPLEPSLSVAVQFRYPIASQP